MIFLMVLFLASVAVYFLERDVQPATFGSVPAAMWWAMATLTTMGYGDVVPITPLGRMVAALVMISGLGVFGLWTGILATGFAAETRRDNFLKTWESVSKVPFFASARPRRDRRRDPHAAHHGPAAAHHDHPQGPARRLHVFHRRRRGRGRPARQEGERSAKARSSARWRCSATICARANVTTTRLSRLLVLDLVDFRLLMARHPDLAETIDAEAKRRAQENK